MNLLCHFQCFYQGKLQVYSKPRSKATENNRSAGSDPADPDLSRVRSEDPSDSIGVWLIQDRPAVHQGEYHEPNQDQWPTPPLALDILDLPYSCEEAAVVVVACGGEPPQSSGGGGEGGDLRRGGREPRRGRPLSGLRRQLCLRSPETPDPSLRRDPQESALVGSDPLGADLSRRIRPD
ncbi:hypothetical protein Taro_008361 [Colocasia esculenta]|uniref:Uncharacterized protein n=1 Tax=Colocasia esculenta TaxID=4460 RepID=A0A843U0V4_COLES|nr:hypothetical protein [Colocasia esculenta]